MNIVPFEGAAQLPAYLSSVDPKLLTEVNKDVVRQAQYPTLHIKGKVFALNKDGVRKIITKPDEPDEVAQSIGVVMLRATMTNKVFYLKRFTEGDSEGARPDCYSHDGIAPSPNSPTPQSKKCATCPNNVWGSRVAEGDRPGEERKGKACADNARIAVATPTALGEAMLLRVPPASLKNLREAVKLVNQRKIPYNAVVMKLSFDPEAATPLLRFKPIGLLNDVDYAQVQTLYESDLVRAIVGVDDEGPQAAAAPEEGPVSADELDAAIAARAASNKAATVETPAPAVPEVKAPPAEPKPRRKAAEAPAPVQAPTPAAPAPAPAPVAAAPAPAPVASSSASDLLSDLDSLLGSTDD